MFVEVIKLFLWSFPAVCPSVKLSIFQRKSAGLLFSTVKISRLVQEILVHYRIFIFSGKGLRITSPQGYGKDIFIVALKLIFLLTG